VQRRDGAVRAALGTAAVLVAAGALAFATLAGDTAPMPPADPPAAGQLAAPPPPGTPEGTAPPAGDAAGQAQAALVAAEDDRILAIVSEPPPGRVSGPYEVPPLTPGGPATTVLTARTQPYDLAALERLGAARAVAPGTWTLDRSVLVGRGAVLRIVAPGAVLRLPGLTSVVAFKGALEVAGAPEAPLTVTSWDDATGGPDRDPADGRGYLRSSGGRMDLRDLRATDLGFWSGRTGGVAWTGSAGEPGTGSATGVTAERNHYGLFSSRVVDLAVTGGAVRDNAVDGVLVHRESVGVRVVATAVSGNGRHGVAVSPGTERTTLTGVVVERNADTGVRLDGSPLAETATAGGASTRPGTGFTVEGSTVSDNGRVGVLADATAGLVLRDNAVTGSPDGVVVRGAAVDPQVVGNRVTAADVGVAVRAGVVGAQVTGNTVGPATIAVQVDDATARVGGNTVEDATRYGVSLVGAVGGAQVDGNVLGGRGLAALDVNRVALGAVVTVGLNDDTGWTVDRDEIAYWREYIAEHPVLWLWLLLLLLPLAGWWSRRRPGARAPVHPYAHVPPGPPAAGSAVPPGRPALTPADRLALTRASLRAAELRPPGRADAAADAKADAGSDEGRPADGVESTVALPVTRVTVVSGKGAAR
jgi:hypothetical protein